MAQAHGVSLACARRRQACRWARSQAAVDASPPRSVVDSTSANSRAGQPSGSNTASARWTPDLAGERQVRLERPLLGLEAPRSEPGAQRLRRAPRAAAASRPRRHKHLRPAPVLHRSNTNSNGGGSRCTCCPRLSAAATRACRHVAQELERQVQLVRALRPARARPAAAPADARGAASAQRLARPEREEQPHALGRALQRPGPRPGRAGRHRGRRALLRAANRMRAYLVRRGARAAQANQTVPTGLPGVPAVRAGDAAHGHGDVAPEPLERPAGHFADRRPRSRPRARQRSAAARRAARSSVRWCRPPPRPGTSDCCRPVRAGLGDPAPGAGLGGHELPPGGKQVPGHFGYDFVQVGHRVLSTGGF